MLLPAGLLALSVGCVDPPPGSESGEATVGLVLPDRRLTVVNGGVLWPHPTEDPHGAVLAAAASDHRLVWLDLAGPFPRR
jgi:hypothetical protein